MTPKHSQNTLLWDEQSAALSLRYVALSSASCGLDDAHDAGIRSVLTSEVCMSGRRSHVRFAVIRSPEGTLRVMRDVLVERADDGEVIAVGREAGVTAEVVAVEFPAGDATAALRVRVIESQPIVVNGSIRHRLRLREVTAAPPGNDGDRIARGSRPAARRRRRHAGPRRRATA